jgi:DNA-binding LacI/PurR family transcriptional regulator
MNTRPNSYDVARLARVSRPVVSAIVNGNADKCGIARQTWDRGGA